MSWDVSGGSRDDGTVWYVAYGSNLHGARLQRYLDQVPGRAEPLEDRPVTVAHRLFFARESRSWTGGAAFLDPAPLDAATEVTYGRAWRLTRSQFLWVLAQENGHEGLDPDLEARYADAFDVTAGSVARVDRGWYGLVLGCPSPDGRPALTFTTHETPLPARNAPSERYVATIVAGLVEGHGLGEDEARAYLRARYV